MPPTPPHLLPNAHPHPSIGRSAAPVPASPRPSLLCAALQVLTRGDASALSMMASAGLSLERTPHRPQPLPSDELVLAVMGVLSSVQPDADRNVAERSAISNLL